MKTDNFLKRARRELIGIRGLCLVCLLWLPGTRVLAHDFYILPDTFKFVGGQELRVGFHNGDAFPRSENSPVIARLKDAQLWSMQNIATIQNLRAHGHRVTGTVTVPHRARTVILSARTAPNLITLGPDKFTAYLHEEGLTDVIDWRRQHGESDRPGRERYSKFAKAVLSDGTADADFGHPLGFPIEIFLEKNPNDVKVGDQLPVRLLLRGQAAVGVPMEASSWDGTQSNTMALGRTDSDGRIRVPLGASGHWRLHSVIMERCREPSIAEWESLWTSLTFEIRKR